MIPYFLWLQGMLKIDPAQIIESPAATIGLNLELSKYLDSKAIMGIIKPTVLVGLLVAIPYIDRNPYRSLFKRPVAVGIGLLLVMVLFALSYVGLPIYGIETPAATRIIQDMAPEEGVGPLREVPFDQLVPGVYTVSENPPDNLCPSLDYGCPALTEFFHQFNERIMEAATNERLPAELRLPNPEAVMVIEDWQQDLRKVTMRIAWQDAVTPRRLLVPQRFPSPLLVPARRVARYPVPAPAH